MQVTLNPIQSILARLLGKNRHRHAEKSGRRNKHGCKAKDSAENELGALGEQAFCKALNVFNPYSINTYKSKADVGSVEVRTRSKPTYQLIVRWDDCDNRAYVLVRKTGPDTFEVVGWIMGKDAKKDDWLQNYGDRPAAYFVPDEALRSLDGEDGKALRSMLTKELDNAK